MGFKPRTLDRCRGWVNIKELDVEAESRALRALQDAVSHGGLLARAVIQLQLNFEHAGKNGSKTWMGKLLKSIRKTWPRFRVRIAPVFELCGIPTFPPEKSLQQTYITETGSLNWKIRQESLLCKPPSYYQQDFVLYKILVALSTAEQFSNNKAPLSGPIFPLQPEIGAESFKCLLRFLSGRADFARVNAHRPRWTAFPGLRESPNLKRICLFCWVKHGRQCRDSEWHAFFDCHVCLAPRRRFQLALLSLNSSVIFFDKNRAGRIAIVSDLVNLVIQC